MYKYKITLQTDSGKFNLTTFARNEYQAKQIICECEGCPQLAIKKVICLNPPINLGEILTEVADRMN